MLLAGARAWPTAQSELAVVSLLRHGIDWNAFLTLARRQALLPLLSPGLREALQPDILREVRESRCQTASNNAFLLKEMIATLNFLTGRGVRALPYKGPVLAHAVYGNPALRPTSDIDLLIHPLDYARCLDMMIARGFRIDMQLNWKHHLRRARLRRNPAGQGPHGLDVHWVDVDLHRSVIPGWYGFVAGFDALWQRRAVLSVGGTALPGLSQADLLIVLCLDLAKDVARGFQVRRLLKVIDIFHLLTCESGLDWQHVAALADEITASRVVSLGLLITHRLYGTPIPEPFRPSPSLRRLANRVLRDLLASEDAAHGAAYRTLRECGVLLRLQQGWRQRAGLLHNRLKRFSIVTSGAPVRDLLHGQQRP